MNKEQIAGVVRSAILLFSGWATTYGITNEEWLAFAGGIAAIVTVGWSIYSNRPSQISH